MEDVFDRFFNPPFENGGTAIQAWSPRVDVDETEKEIVVKADLPGVEAKDVEVFVSNGMLVLKGEKKEEREEKKKNYHCVERFVGKFYRELPLPAGADANNITASTSKAWSQ
jgi:HSP20 family protein